MAIGLDDIDPDSDGTRIVIQNPLDMGNVDHSSQMFTKSKTDANGYFTLKSVVSFFNTDYNPTPGKVLALDPESMTTIADDGRGIQCSLLCMKKNRGTLREYFIPLKCCHAVDKNLAFKETLDYTKDVLYNTIKIFQQICDPSKSEKDSIAR